MPTYSALPWRTAVASAPIVSSSGVSASKRWRVEDVEVVDADAPEALVEAGEDVLARTAALAVRARPHVPAGLAADDQLVAVGGEVLAQDPPEVDLGAAVRRAVVVGQVEVGDPEVEGGVDHRPLRRERRRVAEVVPEAEREERAAGGRCGRRSGRSWRRSDRARGRRSSGELRGCGGRWWFGCDGGMMRRRNRDVAPGRPPLSRGATSDTPISRPARGGAAPKGQADAEEPASRGGERRLVVRDVQATGRPSGRRPPGDARSGVARDVPGAGAGQEIRTAARCVRRGEERRLERPALPRDGPGGPGHRHCPASDAAAPATGGLGSVRGLSHPDARGRDVDGARRHRSRRRRPGQGGPAVAPVSIHEAADNADVAASETRSVAAGRPERRSKERNRRLIVKAVTIQPR